MRAIELLDIECDSQPKEDILARLPAWDIEEAKTRLPKNYTRAESQNEWLAKDEVSYVSSILSKAALMPEYGRVVIAGIWTPDGIEQFVLGDSDDLVFEEAPMRLRWFDTEEELLKAIWKRLQPKSLSGDGPILTGWNILGYDLPFLVKRSWILGVPVPAAIFNPLNTRYPWPQRVVDLMTVYSAGRREDGRTKLSTALKALNLPPKDGDGRDFPALWSSDRKAALAYSRKDLVVEGLITARLGLIRTPEPAIPVMTRMDMEETLP